MPLRRADYLPRRDPYDRRLSPSARDQPLGLEKRYRLPGGAHRARPPVTTARERPAQSAGLQVTTLDLDPDVIGDPKADRRLHGGGAGLHVFILAGLYANLLRAYPRVSYARFACSYTNSRTCLTGRYVVSRLFGDRTPGVV